MMKELTLQEVQQESLRILKVVHDFCEKNDIQYSLTGGTLIGAARHKGFIPWDDDIDILMTRPNFDKFCNSFVHEGFSIKQPGDKDYWLKFARVFDDERTIVTNHVVPTSKQDYGIWIDIFPIDGAPKDDRRFNKLAQRCKDFKFYTWRCRHYKYDYAKSLEYSFPKNVLYLLKSSLAWCKTTLKFQLLELFKYRSLHCVFKPLDSLIKDEVVLLHKNKFGENEYCCGLCFAFRNYFSRYKTNWFDDYVLIPFEDAKFYAMSGYKEFLTEQYGDYMKMPPVEKQVPKHNQYKIFYINTH